MKKKLTFTLVIMLLFMVTIVTGCKQKDETAPVFEGATNGVLSTMNVLVGEKNVNLLDGVIATDDVDGEVQVVVNKGNFDVKVVGEYTITYTATDAASNIATVTRKVCVVDTVKPLFKYSDNGVLPAISIVQYKSFDLLEDYVNLDVKDNYDTDLTPFVKDNGGFDVEKVGEYTITYAVKDSSNNETTATLKVTVIDGLKVVEDVLKLKNSTLAVPAIINQENAMALDENGILNLRSDEKLNIFTKEFYISELAKYSSSYTKNGGIPFLPWGACAILDSDFKFVLVRNATYGLEAQRNADGTFKVLKNGTDDNGQPVKLTFIDSLTEGPTGVGILGHTEGAKAFEEYIPDGGYVLLAGTPHDGSDGKTNVAKNFIINTMLDANYSAGALSWTPGVFQAACIELLEKAEYEFVEDYTTIYEKPAKYAAPVLSIDKHVLSWEPITDCYLYEIYIDDELVLTTKETSHKMVDFELATSAEGETYKIQVKALTHDITLHTDSDMSEELSYAMPELTTLVMGEVTLTSGVLNWDAVEGATKYFIYASQGLGDVKLAEVTDTTYDLTKDSTLKGYVYNAKVFVVAVGDGNTILDSEASNENIFLCSAEKVITFGDGAKYPVIVTTAKDYFARRNDGTEVGYSLKEFLFIITDPQNILETNAEAYSFIVGFNKDGVVKNILNITPAKQSFVNGEWVASDTIGYTSNGKQEIRKFFDFVEGDVVLIGKNGGTKQNVPGLDYQLQTRDLVSHYFWGPYLPTSVVGSSDPWRSDHTINTYPTYTIKNKNELQLEKPVLSLNGTTISWNAVEGATMYDVVLKPFNQEQISFETSELSVDLAKEIASIGRSGSYGWNYTDVDVEVVAKADGRQSSEAALNTYTLKSQVTDGTDSVNVTYELASSFYNGGSGASLRGNDTVSTLMTGKTYKQAVIDYKSGYANNSDTPFMQNGIIIVFDKDLKVKTIRFGYVNVVEIRYDEEGNASYVKTDLTWDNSTIVANKGNGGNFINLANEVADDELLLIGANVGSKAQMTALFKMFVDTNTADVIGKTLVPNADSTTKVDCSSKTYTLNITCSEKDAE